MKIYIAGRIGYERNRFGLPVDIFRDPDSYWIACYPSFKFSGQYLMYTGPFTVGCDHGCAHQFDHAVGPTCGNDAMQINTHAVASGNDLKKDLRELVIRKTTKGIEHADVFFAWLGSDSQLAHGTIAEIGYAAGLGKPIYIGYGRRDSKETWYAKTLATKTYCTDDFESFFSWALNDHLDMVRPACK